MKLGGLDTLSFSPLGSKVKLRPQFFNGLRTPLPKEIEMAFLPGRKVVTRSPHRRVGYISCPWFQADQIEYESLLEQGFIRIALLCPGLERIRAQPFKLCLANGLHYTPDFLLTFDDSTRLVVEVKPSAHVPKHHAKLVEAKEILGTQGYQFLTCTEREIDNGDRRNRAARILRQAISTASEKHIEVVRRYIPNLKFPISLTQLEQRTGLARHDLYAVIGRRALHLRSDLSLDHVYSSTSFKGNARDGSSYSAWIGAQDW